MAVPTSGSRSLANRPRLAAALALAALVLIGLSWPRQAHRWLLELEMATATSPMGQVFSSTQAGYGEEASVLLPLIADGSRQRYTVEIPTPVAAMRVRIDPGSSPGSVHLYSVRILSPFQHSLSGDPLRATLRPLNDLTILPDGGDDAVAMESTGNDPFFDITIDAPPEARILQLGKRVALVAGLLLLSLVTLGCWRIWLDGARGLAARHSSLAAVSMAMATLVVLTVLGLGCATTTCSPRGLGYGLTLFIGAICIALVGAMCLVFASAHRRDRQPRLFMAILVGQAALVLYIYLRSALHAAVPILPLTRFEFILIVAASAAVLWRRSGGTGAVAHLLSGRWLAVELGCLFAICLVVADRELPRLVMLSSDPDVHAFFARQLERFGAIYRAQGEWGSEAITYPAGSPALIYAWSRLTWLDVSNTLAALPLLQALVAALAIGELFAARSVRHGRAAILMLLALAVTAAGFLFPIYSRFSHMEGVGRQLSIACVALVIVIMCNSVGSAARQGRLGNAALLAIALFALAALNPVNVVVPCILVLGCMAYAATRREPLPWLLVLACLACPLLLLMDPYYLQLLTGNSATAKVSLDGSLVRMSAADIGAGWATQLTHHLRGLVLQEFKLIPDHPFPTFLALAGGLLVALLAASSRGTGYRHALAFGLVVSVSILLASALMQAVASDSRLYLLPYYFQFSLAQYRVLLLTLMAVSVVALAWRRRAGATRIAVLLVACVALPYLLVRPVQPMRFEPRVDYCGSLGCASPSDVAVVRTLEQMVRSHQIKREDGMLPRILVPNLQASSGPESWVFPTGGSRYLALADALPVAFYYYQGDGDFTTGNYMARVCTELDREWLRAERIHYVFLPEQREGTCMATVETLSGTDEVVVRQGNSMVIRLRGAND